MTEFLIKIMFLCVLICIFSVTKYHLRFNDFENYELEKVNLDKAVNAGQLGGQ